MTTRVAIVASILCVWVGVALAQQPQNAPQQPGLRWTEDQITKVAHHVRAGRKLIPKSWPNGARVAVCISFDPDNFSIQLNRGDSNPVGISVGVGLPTKLRFQNSRWCWSGSPCIQPRCQWAKSANWIGSSGRGDGSPRRKAE